MHKCTHMLVVIDCPLFYADVSEDFIYVGDKASRILLCTGN